MNNKTTIGTIFTVIGLIPAAISQLNLAVVPQWLVTTGLVCAAISFIYAGVSARDADNNTPAL